MKKLIIFLFVVTSIYLSNQTTEDIYVIPKESIRMRVIANSNDAEDQIEKYNLVESFQNIIYNIESNSNSIEDSRYIIEESITQIENKLSELSISGSVTFGNNYFPEKTYEQIKYEAGEYESLVITIGEGLGDNWWCVLFPPLCKIEQKKNSLEELEYTFYIMDIINKFK